MGKILQIVLMWFSSYFIAGLLRWLFSGAVGLVGYGIVTAIFTRYVNNALSQLNNVDEFAFFLHLSRLDECISIVLSAMTVKAMLIATKVSFGTNS